MDRKGYQKLQAQARRDSAEMLQRFKEANPTRFAELQAQAEREVLEPPPPRPITRYTLRRTRALTEEDIDRIAYPPTERHYLILAKDKWGDEHRFFESATPDTLNEFDVLQMLNEKHPRYDLTEIISITPCKCPACTHCFPSS